MDVSMDQPENLLFTWNSGFGNHHYNAEDDLLLGTKGTIFRGRYRAEYIPEGRHARRSAGEAPAAPPAPKVLDAVSRSDGTNEHFQNFFDCMRSRKEPNCPFELGYRSAIACQIAIRSYHEVGRCSGTPNAKKLCSCLSGKWRRSLDRGPPFQN